MMKLMMTEEDEATVKKVAEAMHTVPAMIADAFGISPERIEKLLRKRRQIKETESISEAMQRNYPAALKLILEDWER